MFIYNKVEKWRQLCYYIGGEIMKKILTLVVDGIGEAENEEGNALQKANMPNYLDLLEKYPHSFLEASGESVGLRIDQPGNREIGFKTLGAGQILRQRSSFVREFVDKDSLATNSMLKNAIEHAKKYKSTIHIMGLMSDAGINSNIKDTIKIIEFLKSQEVKMVIDFIADGKDVEAKSALTYIKMLEETEVPIATICGRYYAMDEEGKWDRVKIYYDLVRNGVGLRIKEVPLALKNCYIRNITDEFLPPIVVEQNKQIKNNDIVIWTNYEDEGAKEILTALSNPGEISEFDAVKIGNFKLLMLYPVDPKIDATVLINEEDDTSNNIGKYFGKLGLTQARIALKSSYESVTYFFNGETAEKIPKCNNYLVEIPKIDTERRLELGAASVTKQIVKCMEKDTDFILASIDIADEVAHTGNMEETVKMLEFVDECIGRIVESASLNFYTIVLTSTHGNVEEMLREENKASTVNTSNKVPFIMTDNKLELSDGALTDVAPTILSYMDISVPESMNQSKILIKE